MPEPLEPPPRQTLLAAAGGGFIGAVVGVIAATSMMGDGDNGNSQSALDPQQNTVEVVETKVASN